MTEPTHPRYERKNQGETKKQTQSEHVNNNRQVQCGGEPAGGTDPNSSGWYREGPRGIKG